MNMMNMQLRGLKKGLNTRRPARLALLGIALAALALLGLFGAFQLSGDTVQAQSNFDYDFDDDNLIEVTSLAKLNAIRWDLDGDGVASAGNEDAYAAAFFGAPEGMGCPDTCKGYELEVDLDFDTNENGEADAGDAYWNDGLGWTPIESGGGEDAPIDHGYLAEFHGNGHTISNLYIRGTRPGWNTHFGLFGMIAGSAYVHHVGLPNVDIDTVGNEVGALVGNVAGGQARVSASYATGEVSGSNETGGLVGTSEGDVQAVWTQVTVHGTKHVGGLIGLNGGLIVSGYALGSVSGDDRVHGVVGLTEGGEGLRDVYYSWHHHPALSSPYSRTPDELREPAGYTGIYANWNVDLDGDGAADDPWDFGSEGDYPRLKADRNGDGAATADEFSGQQAAEYTFIDYDSDDDGLIEVSNLAQLNAIRWDKDGDGWASAGNEAAYAAAFNGTPPSAGCPDTCKGYELVADLDFDTNGDGRGDEKDALGGGGWRPIGGDSDEYTAEFHGNGHTISHMFMNTARNHLGLFGKISGSSFVHHVGMVNVNLHGYSGNEHMGALVGEVASNKAAVAASYATGQVLGALGSSDVVGTDNVGGLVGTNHGYVVASWTNTKVIGGHYVAGVVGDNSGAVLSVYALGTAKSHHGYKTRHGHHGVVGYTFYQTDLESVGVYYNWDAFQEADQETDSPYAKTTAELKEPTDYTGIFSTWNVDTDLRPAGIYSPDDPDDPWDFGASDELPALKADRDGDGVATWREFGVQTRGGRDYDGDNDNLIYVSSMEKLNAIRFDLDGNGFPETGHAQYKEAFPDAAYGMGCRGTCQGYELSKDLDHDTNGNGEADAGDAHWNDGAGWRPIGHADDGAYTGEFNGNGHTISNLYVNRTAHNVGLFGWIGGSAYIHHVGLPDVDIATAGYNVGALVGYMNDSKGRVTANYATGSVSGAGQTGGLVGSAWGYVAANWAEVSVHGTNEVGGLVGRNGGLVESGYSLGTVSGNSHVHGVVGLTAGGEGLRNVYFNSSINPGIDDAYAKTGEELQQPTDYTGIYADWNVDLDGDGSQDDPWDFWRKNRYPRLKADRNGDGKFTRSEFGGQNPGTGIKALQDYDADDDNLIDVTNLDQLNAIRFDLDGDGNPAGVEAAQYVLAYPDGQSGTGCPDACIGYELNADLDFDTNGSGAADAGDAYWNGGAGWRPIGYDGDGAYTGEFNGNGRSVSNLFINRDGNQVGLFGKTGGSANVHHVGLPNVEVAATGYDVGALVGRMEGAQTRASSSYATGKVAGAGQTGGLVGNTYGKVQAVWAQVRVFGTNEVGGLVGRNHGLVEAGHALGAVSGNSYVHGAVGLTQGGEGLRNVYFNSDNHPVSDPAYSRTTAELQTPTDYTGIYADWNLDLDGDGSPDNLWDFGAAGDYPRLTADRDGDGDATVGEFPGQETTGQSNKIDYDTNDDNLIEITDLDQLNAMRWDLDGDGNPDAREAAQYVLAYPDHPGGMGCPDTCIGYELMNHLNFDVNRNSRGDEGDLFWNDGAGWDPIGGTTPYTGEFDGNGYNIRGLYINRTANQVGLFGEIGGSGFVHHVGLSYVDITTDGNDVGALVGWMQGNGTAVAASYATGKVTGGGQTGGLVGSNQGWVVASWTNVTVHGAKHVGGLVGHNGGAVTSAYALGTVSGSDRVHGVVGWSEGGRGLWDVYYNFDDYPVSDPPYSKTTAELQTPTDYEGIYANWDLDTDRRPAGVYSHDDPWDFGTDSDYPQLRVTRSTYTDQLPPVNIRIRANDGTAQSINRGSIVHSGDPIKAQFRANYPEGQLADSEFSQTAGPEVIVTRKTDSFWTFYAADTASATTLEFTFSATDNNGETSSVSWDLGLHPVPPTAVATVSDNVTGGELVTLSGADSYAGFKYFYSDDAVNPNLPNPVRPVKSYQWAQTGGPDVTLNCALTGPQIGAEGCENGVATFTVPSVEAPTSLSFELTVTDERDLTGSRGVSVPLTATGRSSATPTACAGPDLTAERGHEVILQGTCSTNPYGEWWQMQHQWTQLSGPSVTLTHPQAESLNQAADRFGDPRFTLPPDVAVGATLEFQLTVIDEEGETDTDTVTVAVVDVTPPTLASATTSADGTKVTITFTEPVQISPLLDWFITQNNLPSASLFILSVLNVEVDGAWPSQTGASVSGDTVTVTMDQAITQGQDVKVRYDGVYAKQAPEILMDQAGNPMTNFGASAVANRSTVAAFDAPQGITMSARELTITEGESASYTIALSAQPSGDVTVGLVATKPNNVTISASALTFTAENWNTAQTVTVSSTTDENNYGYWVTIVHSAEGSDYPGQDAIKILMEE